MKFSLKLSLSLAFLIFLSSCALAPFTEPHTAETLGKGGNQWALAGGGPSYLSVNYARGFTDRLDIGGTVEYQSLSYIFGLNAKYLLTTKPQHILGPDIEPDPTALIFGAGIGGTSQYVYAGVIKSFRLRHWYELGLSGRVNVFHWDFDDRSEASEAEDYMDDLINDTVDSVSGVFSYVSVDASNTFWLNSRLGLTLSVSRLQFVTRATGGTFKAGLKMHYKY